MSETSVAVTRKVVGQLRVKNAAGTLIYGPTSPRRLKLTAGRGVSILGDPSTGLVTLASPEALRGPDPYYVNKYRDILYGTAAAVPDPGTDPQAHPSYWFTRDLTDTTKVKARYLATVNGMAPHPLDGVFFVEGGACWQVGCYDGASSTALNLALSGARGLTLENKCQPPVDCRDYHVIYEAMERIRLFLQNNRDKNCCVEGSYKLLEQWKATVHYWNYLMYRKKAGVTARALRAGIAASARYEHLCCNPSCPAGGASSSSSASSAGAWTCSEPLVFHMRVERLTCLDVPLKYNLYVTDVTSNPRNVHYSMAYETDYGSTMPESSSSSSSATHSECLTTGGSFDVWISLLDPLQFRDFVEAQMTIAVTLPDGAKTTENLAKLQACGGFEGAVKFRVRTSWTGSCPVDTYAEEEMWVKLLMDEMDIEPSSWACGKPFEASPFLLGCEDYGILDATETQLSTTGATWAAAEAAADAFCSASDASCAGLPCGCYRSNATYSPGTGLWYIRALHCCQ